MRTVAIGSAFRNSGGHGAAVYMERVAKLRDHLRGVYEIRVIAVEGDSEDKTADCLRLAAGYHGLPLDLVTCNHGGPVFGSVESTERFAALSKVGNAIFDAVQPDDDALIYVESDLLWQPPTFERMLDVALETPGIDVVAPMVMAGPNFYDIWAFRDLNGERFSSLAPFHRELKPHHFMQLGSAGSCLVMRGDVARACRIRNSFCLVGWCEDARLQGYKIWVDPDETVRQL